VTKYLGELLASANDVLTYHHTTTSSFNGYIADDPELDSSH